MDILKNAKEEAVKNYLKPNGNVVGIGIGKKQVKGTLTDTDCLRFYVVRKQEKGEDFIPQSQVIPTTATSYGVPTDIIEVGRFGRPGRKAQEDTGTTTRPGSPIRVKTGVTNVNEGARGTLGAVVTDGEAYYILSCNHVLAVNGRVPADPKSAQVVSAEFVGDESRIADRDEFVAFRRDAGNPADCALARLTGRAGVLATFPDGTIALASADVAAPQPGMCVRKLGAGTGLTHGTIVDIDADLFVEYSFGTFCFDHQMIIESSEKGGEFATNGDSGAIVVAGPDGEPGLATGMIFAASGDFAVACPLKTVLAELNSLESRKSKTPLTLVVADFKGTRPAGLRKKK